MTDHGHPFRLDIEVRAPARFAALQHMFAALVHLKRAQFHTDDEDEEDEEDEEVVEPNDPRWRALLDTEALAHFASAFDRNREEGRTHQRLWELTEPARRGDPIFQVPGPWPFDAVIAGIYRAEYMLERLTRVSEEHAVLTYDPFAGPFGGTAPLVELVEGFGQLVRYDSWNVGPPHRPVVGWDFERAAQLVRARRGV